MVVPVLLPSMQIDQRLSSFGMRVIGRRTLQMATAQLTGTSIGLDTWLRAASKASWRGPVDVRRTYPGIDTATFEEKGLTVFPIGNNKFRLIAKIDYEHGIVIVKEVGDAAEYTTQENARNERRSQSD